MLTTLDGDSAVVPVFPLPNAVLFPHTVLPLSVDGLGEVRILVPTARLVEAREVLAEHLRDGMEAIPGGASR